jgi:hypothetical protein
MSIANNQIPIIKQAPITKHQSPNMRQRGTARQGTHGAFGYWNLVLGLVW